MVDAIDGIMEELIEKREALQNRCVGAYNRIKFHKFCNVANVKFGHALNTRRTGNNHLGFAILN